MFWRELYFLTGSANYELLYAPSIDLTRASNSTMTDHKMGMQALMFFSGGAARSLIRDGRGDGKSYLTF